ncbi:hypothetical protein BM1_05759 [Bipolaris maydis]|nr:hypothetical protein BM1_05759 [Bipolaris maydis]
MELDDGMPRERILMDRACRNPASPAIEANTANEADIESLSLESSLQQSEIELVRLQRLVKALRRPLPSQLIIDLDEMIQIWRSRAALRTFPPATRSHILLIIGMSLSIRRILKREEDVKSSTEDMVQAIKVFVECLMISNRHDYEGISARSRRLFREMEELIEGPYYRELVEQIIEPLRTLRSRLPELEMSRRWLVALSNIHIARYLHSDLEATDSLDDAIQGLDHWQNNFPDDPMFVSWYPDLVGRHAAKFLATEKIEIVDRLIKILSWIRIPSGQSLEDDALAKKLGEVFIKVLQRFYRQNADFRDLHRAVRIYDEFKNYMVIKDPWMPALLWCTLSDASGTWGDADRAYRLMEVAMKEHPPNVECLTDSTCVCISTMFAVQHLKYSRTKESAILDENIAKAETLLAEAVNNAKAWSYITSQLADLYAARGKSKMENSDKRGAEEDLRQAMLLAEAHLAKSPGEFRAASSAANICKSLFDITKERSFIDKAIIHSVSECDRSESRDEPQFSGDCYNTGSLLLQRNRVFHDTKDREQALDILKRGYQYTRGNLELRIFCAHEVAQAMEEESRWVEASSFYRLTIELIQSFELQHMKNVDKQRKISQFSLAATSAAAALLNAGGSAAEALCLLESGRDLLANSLRELRGDISQLQDAHPALAKDFITLREVIDVSPDERAAVATAAIESIPELHRIDRQYAVNEFRSLIHEIRKLPDFTEFLATPTVKELMSGARNGSVVVLNYSQSRCDAILVTVDKISHLRLPIKGMHVVRKVRQLRVSGISFQLLKWLWDIVVSPVLKELGYDKAPPDGKHPRVWWIPTGYFSLLPIHAAGVHDDNSPNTAMDRVMSSYATSFKSLLDGRHRIGTNQESDSSKHIRRAALVSMSTTPGLGQNHDLPFAEEEIRVVKGLMTSLKLEVAEPSPNRLEVLDELRRSQILHFAGHGGPNDENLSASSILLSDWKANPLTTEDVRSTSLADSPQFLAYLSACSTGPNNNASTLLIDENIHLISSFRLAGFRHVIGTLWDVQDEYCVDIARIFYETLRDEEISDDAVCLGLHRAIMTLRNRTIGTLVKMDSSLTKTSVENTSVTTVDISQTVNTTSIDLVGVNKPPITSDMRTAKLVNKLARQENRLHPRYWAPYVHFGL